MYYDIKVDDPNNLFYDTKCWAIKKQHINKISVAEMRMLRWISEKVQKNRIRNEKISLKIEVAPINEKIEREWLNMVWSCSKESD